MRKIVLACLVLSVLFVPHTVLAKSKIDQAREYVTIGEKSSAHRLLREAILNDPMDADTHYEAGVIFGEIGYAGDFNKAMENACKLDNGYCFKVADLYYSSGFNELNRGSARIAVVNFDKAFRYNPTKKTATLQQLLESGKRQLNSFNSKSADTYFSMLSGFDSSRRSEIAKIYYAAGKAASPEKIIEMYRLASKYSSDYEQQIGNHLVALAKSDSYSDAIRDKYKGEAKKYLTEEKFKELFPPDFKIYQPGTYTFNLKAGETTDHWIMFPAGRNNNFNLSSKDYKYIATFAEGDSYNCWEIERFPKKVRAKFKLTAVSNQKIKLVVK